MITKYYNNLDEYQKYAAVFSLFMFAGLVVASLFHKMGAYGVETDFYWAYARDAQNIMNGEMPEEPGVGPGYAIVLIVFNLLFNDWFVSGKMLSIVSAVVGGLFTFGYLRAVFNAKIAFYTLILWHFSVLPFSIVAGTDLFFAMLVAAGLYFLFRGGSLSFGNIIFAALFMGLSYLTRHNAVVLPLGVAFVVLFLNPETWDWITRIKYVLIFAVVFVAVNIPWSVVTMLYAGTAARSDSYLIIASHFYGRPGVVSSEDMRIAAQSFQSLSDVVFYDFAHFVKHYIGNLYRHFYEIMLNSVRFPGLLFAGAGFFMLIPTLNRRQVSLYVFPVLSFLLLCLVHYEPRYYLYIISFFLIPIAYCIYSIDFRMDIRPLLKLSVWRNLAFAATAIFALFLSSKDIRAVIAEEPRELLQVAEMLETKVLDNQSIIARKPHLGYLSNLETKYFPEAKTVQDLLDFAAQENADYLLYGQVEFKRRPELAFLLDVEKAPEQLQPVCFVEEPKTVVYKIQI